MVRRFSPPEISSVVATVSITNAVVTKIKASVGRRTKSAKVPTKRYFISLYNYTISISSFRGHMVNPARETTVVIIGVVFTSPVVVTTPMIAF